MLAGTQDFHYEIGVGTDKGERGMSSKPQLLVTVDTEADDLWGHPRQPTTRNIREVPRLQDLLERHGVRPTYLVSHAVASDRAAAGILAGLLRDGRCEIGAHLHAWATPPPFPIRGPLWDCHAYLYQYPEDVQRAKFAALHETLVRAFDVEPISHRAGKYGLDGHGVGLLREFGYRVDTSVTPMWTWEDDVQAGVRGPDFRAAPCGVYELSEQDVCVAGRSGVMEVPPSIGLTRRLPGVVVGRVRRLHQHGLTMGVLGKLLGLRKRRFRPFIDAPLGQVESAARWLLDRGAGYLNMMFHSSELIPNSQWCRNEAEVATWLGRIEAMIRVAIDLRCETGMTLAEFAESARSRIDGRDRHQET